MTAVPLDDADIDELRIIDDAHLAGFTDGDRTLESELGELFLSTAEGYLRRMREALEEKRSWVGEAHALKGASANLGARRVSALARQAEFQPPSKDHLETLHAAVEDVRTFFADRKP